MPIGSAQVAHAENVGHQTGLKGDKNPGTLKTDTKDYTFYSLGDSSAVTEAVDHFLQEMNRQNTSNETLDGLRMTFITPEMIEIETTIAKLLNDLETQSESQRPLEGDKKKPESQNRPLGGLKNESSTLRQEGQTNHIKNPNHIQTTTQELPPKKIYSSLFDLAKNKSAQSGEKKETAKQEEPTQQKSEKGWISSSKLLFEQPSLEDRRLDREGNGKQDQKGQQEKEENPQNKRNSSRKEKGKKKVGAIQAAQSEATQGEPPEIPAKEIKGNQATSRNVAAPAAAKSGQIVGSVENIYIRFMALMARILGQAEFEAHELYLKIKERTDSIDTLTLLLSKINSEKGAIDWSNDEEMKKLIERARAIGVDIPQDKYKWSEEEKKMLKENVQMRKDSMEKVTQLERTDMQRYLQEASQCHQARSNVLKLLKEVIDTILANMRP